MVVADRMRKRLLHKIIYRAAVCAMLIFMSAFLAMLTGCGEAVPDNTDTYNIYCLDREENRLPYYEYSTQTVDIQALADELTLLLKTSPGDVKKKELIKDFDIEDISLKDKTLILTVSESYANLPPTKEVLIRAGIVRTLGQIEGIDYVTLRYRDRDLTDALGQPVGAMTVTQFVDNAEDDLSTYDDMELTLYFADEDGTGLVKVTRRVEYNTNISLEKLVLEQLIAGTDAQGAKASVNPQTEIINVTVKDGICYVNLSPAFLSLPEGVHADVSIYSIVDSMAELKGISKVMFSIDGNSDIVMGDNISLSGQYERNLDIVR